MVYNASVSVQTGTNETDLTGLAGLDAALGAPRREAVTLRVASLFSAVEARSDRVAEVVFVIRRPNGRLLLQTKAFYPPGAYRLPSGSITAGEPVLAALWREAAEETGLRAILLRFLAVIRYAIVTPESEPAGSPARTFTSYVFLLQETGGELCTADEDERVTGFREIEPGELPGVADRLEALASSPETGLNAWGDWGRFRAIAHRLVWDMLRTEEGPMAGTGSPPVAAPGTTE
jgi:ADP-ribose pyrophosphatase YjhB (NUDIX family)